MDTTPKRHVITDQDVAQLATKVEQQVAHGTKAEYDVAKIVSLRMRHNKTQEEIACQLGISRDTVGRILRRYVNWVENPQELAAYREHKADFLEGMEIKVLDMLNQRLSDPTYKPPIKDLANAMKVLVEVRRLETGQSTDNVAVFIKSIENTHKDLFVDSPEVKELPPDG